jgi:phosphatidylglycerophosphate synthase
MMLDPFMSRLVKPLLNIPARLLARANVSPDHVTAAGFFIGLAGCFMIAAGWYKAALAFILANRIMDGLDGALARQKKASDAGAFLDICLDFVFYSLVVAGFAFADPRANALAAVVLISAFAGTGTSFLAFAVIAAKHRMENVVYPKKSFYYLGGLTEGTETILFFILFCLFPAWFPLLAGIFAGLCVLTTIARVKGGYELFSSHKQVSGEKEAP